MMLQLLFFLFGLRERGKSGGWEKKTGFFFLFWENKLGIFFKQIIRRG